MAGPRLTTIDEVLGAFLAEQKQRLAERTFGNYLEVIDLFRRCMNDYGHTSLSPSEARLWEEAYRAGDDDAFTRLFGPEKIPGEIGQFLGWYVIRKVMPGQELARACGTVTKKLGKWLEANGYLDAGSAADVVSWGVEAGDALPQAEKLAELLYLETLGRRPLDLGSVPDGDWIEDHLLIERVEAGELWFEGGIGRSRFRDRSAILPDPGGRSPSPWPGSTACGASSRSATSTRSPPRSTLPTAHRESRPPLGAAPDGSRVAFR